MAPARSVSTALGKPADWRTVGSPAAIRSARTIRAIVLGTTNTDAVGSLAARYARSSSTSESRSGIDAALRFFASLALSSTVGGSPSSLKLATVKVRISAALRAVSTANR